MSNTQHTPGPYEVHYGHDYTRILKPDPRSTDDYLADITNPDDAPLFAASSEMFSALETVVGTWIAVDGPERECMGMVIDALSKARGAPKP